MTAQSMDELVALAKRRGFIFQSSDIYGGLQGRLRPLGRRAEKQFKDNWWRAVYERDDVGIRRCNTDQPHHAETLWP